jgi:hypothetical protein
MRRECYDKRILEVTSMKRCDMAMIDPGPARVISQKLAKCA